MSHIEELIQKLCPDGVERRRIKEVAAYARNRIDSAEVAAGMYVGVNELKQDYRGRTEEVHVPSEERCIKFEKGDVLLGNIRPYLKKAWLADKTGGTNGDVLVIRPNNDDVLTPAYLFSVLTSADFTHYNIDHSKGSKMPRGDKAAIMNFELPVPPLEIQQEIVRILDAFAELEANLQRELDARKQQYEHYRDELLSFGDEVQTKKLGELFDFKNGLNKGKEHFGHGTPIVNFTDVFKNGSMTAATLRGRVKASDKDIKNCSAEYGDVFFTRTSETPEDVGRASVLLESIPDCVFSGFVLRARPKTDLLLPEYCAYCFSDYRTRQAIRMKASFTTRALTSGSALSKISIPVPPLETQQEIVAKLDAMVALQDNLQRQIDLTHRQYEHCRDQLLDLPRKAA